MFKDLRATRAYFDTDKDRLEIGVPAGAPPLQPSEVVGLLLNEKRHLVGIDVGADASRWVLLLGEHEDVVERVTATVLFAAGSIVIERASRMMAKGPNPYLP